MEEYNVLIETTKSAEEKTSRWFDFPLLMSCSVTCSVWKLTPKIKKLMSKWCQSRKSDNYTEEKVLQTPENKGTEKLPFF